MEEWQSCVKHRALHPKWIPTPAGTLFLLFRLHLAKEAFVPIAWGLLEDWTPHMEELSFEKYEYKTILEPAKHMRANAKTDNTISIWGEGIKQKHKATSIKTQ